MHVTLAAAEKHFNIFYLQKMQNPGLATTHKRCALQHWLLWWQKIKNKDDFTTKGKKHQITQMKDSEGKTVIKY